MLSLLPTINPEKPLQNVCLDTRVIHGTVYMVIHGNTWQCMVIDGSAWLYMAIHGNTWQYMVIYGDTWLYMAIHGNTWQYMVIHGNRCTKLGPVLYGVLVNDLVQS